MNIVSIESRKYKNTNFKLAIVECISAREEFVQLVGRKSLGKVHNLAGKIYTDGEIYITSEKNKDDYVEVFFKLNKASWFLKKESNSIELYIVDGFCGNIYIKNDYLREVLSNCYVPCLERIKNKREYARKINTIARELNLPFNVVLAFKGQEESLKQFENILTKLLKRKFVFNLNIQRKLNSDSHETKYKALKKLNVRVTNKTKPVEDISKYILACLRSKRILVFGEY